MSGVARVLGAEPLRRFKPYPAYKDSGVEWLGEIPAHWEVKRLKHLAALNPESLMEHTDPAREMVYVDIGGVDSLGRIVNREELAFAAAPSRARRLVRNGDVIVSTVRTYLRAIASISDAEPGMVVSTGFAVVRPADNLTTDYAAYALRAPYFVERVVANSKGVSFPAINESEMATYDLACPPEPEQRAIAAFLDRETARIDALVTKKERLIALLHAQRTALIARAVTKGLDPTVPMKDSGVEWLGEIPAHWEVKPVGAVAHSLVGFPFPSEEFSFDEGTRLVRGDNVTTEALRWGDKTRAWLGPAPHRRYYLMAEDVVIGMDGSKVGRNYAMVREEDLPLLLVQRVTRLRARAIIKPAFLFWSIAGPRFHAHVDTHKSDPAIPHITLKDIQTYPIAIPTTDDQLAILNRITVAGGQIHALEKRVRDATDRLKELRTALISAAVTGKVDVREEVA